MRVVIAGASTFAVSNLGDDAMFASLVQAIRRVSPDTDVCLLSRHPSQEFDNYFAVRSVQNLEHASNAAAAGRFFYGLNRGDDGETLHRVFDEISGADLLILAGNLFMEVSPSQHLRGVSAYASMLTVLAQVAGTPTAIFGLNIVEPIRSELTIQHIRHVLDAALAVGLREESAVEYLRDANIKAHSAVVVGDPAVGLEISSRSWPNEEVVASANITPNDGRPIVSLCIRAEYWRVKEKPSLAGRERRGIVQLLEAGARLRAIPNCTYRHGHELEDDRTVHSLLFREFSDEIEFVEKELGVYDTVRLLAESQVHVTNRRHSAILAAHAATTPIAIATSMATHMSGFLSETAMTNSLVPNLGTALAAAASLIANGNDGSATVGDAFCRAVSANRARTDAFLRDIFDRLKKGRQE